DHEFLARGALGLEPGARSSRSVGRGRTLGDDALQLLPARLPVELTSLTRDMIAVADHGRTRVLEETGERAFPLPKGHAGQIESIEVKEIENEEYELPVPSPAHRVLQILEAGDAVGTQDHHLAVDQRALRRQGRGGRG